jgi:hypothetical protein
MTDQRSHAQAELQTLFGFTIEDLRANKGGELSTGQKAMLRNHSRRNALLTMLVIAAVGSLTLFTAVETPQYELNIFLVGMGISLAAVLYFTIGRAETAISRGVVEKRSGQLHRRYGGFNWEPPVPEVSVRGARWVMLGSYMIYVQGIALQVDRAQYEALSGAYYNLYLIPSLGRIASIEPLSYVAGPGNKRAPAPLEPVVETLPAPPAQLPSGAESGGGSGEAKEPLM